MMLELTSLANEYLSTNEISKRNGMVARELYSLRRLVILSIQVSGMFEVTTVFDSRNY